MQQQKDMQVPMKNRILSYSHLTNCVNTHKCSHCTLEYGRILNYISFHMIRAIMVPNIQKLQLPLLSYGPITTLSFLVKSHATPTFITFYYRVICIALLCQNFTD